MRPRWDFLRGLFSCEKDTGDNPSPLFTEKEYAAQFRTEGLKFCGAFKLYQDGSLLLIHNDPSSPLYGLEEWSDGKQNRVKLFDVEWKDSETDLFVTKLCRAFTIIEEPISQEGEEEINGSKCKMKYYQTSQAFAYLWQDEKSGEPIRFQYQEQGFQLEIDFQSDTIK